MKYLTNKLQSSVNTWSQYLVLRNFLIILDKFEVLLSSSNTLNGSLSVRANLVHCEKKSDDWVIGGQPPSRFQTLKIKLIVQVFQQFKPAVTDNSPVTLDINMTMSIGVVM